MTNLRNISSALALIALAQPATAGVREAAFATSADRAEMRTGMFAGATWRVGFDGSREARKPRTTLQIAGFAQAPGRPTMQLGTGLEFTRSADGRTQLSVAGMPAQQIQKRLNMSGGAKTALIIGGAVVLVGGALLIAGANQWKDTELDLGD